MKVAICDVLGCASPQQGFTQDIEWML
jgi:hypothetical protein